MILILYPFFFFQMHLGAGGSSKNYRTWARVYCFCVSKRMQFHAVSLLTLFPLNKDNFYHRHSKSHDKARGNRVLKGFFHQSLWNTRLVCAVAVLDCAHSINCICALASLLPTLLLRFCLSIYIALQSDRSFMVWVMLLLLKSKKLKDSR